MTRNDDITPIADLRAPGGAMWKWAGMYYKQGVHGKVFVWSGSDWRLSDQHVTFLESAGIPVCPAGVR